MNKTFDIILNDFLIENELSPAEFALKANVTQSQVAQWLQGKTHPNYHTLRKIVLAFGLSSDWLGLKD